MPTSHATVLYVLMLGLGIASFVSIRSVGGHVRTEYSTRTLPPGTTLDEVSLRVCI
jgi:hypothetical protein